MGAGCDMMVKKGADRMLLITALMDDMPGKDPILRAEHGLSFYIEYEGHGIIFDCGQSGAALENAMALGLSVEKAEAVVISHGHYDHAGGYRAFAEKGCAGTVFTGPGFFRRKLSRKGEALRDLSAGFDEAFLTQMGVRHRQVEGILELMPGAWLIGGFPRRCGFEKIPERFLRETPEGLLPDDFSDEICMAFQVRGGLAVLVGCSHPGIVNMLTHVKETLKQPIAAVFGGSHLVEADEARIRATMEALEDMGVTRLGLSHCSGEAVRQGRIALGETIVYE